MLKPKRQFASRLTEHQEISDVFLVTQKSLALNRNNQPYLRLTLSDRTGTVEARAWEGAQALDSEFQRGDMVRVQGRVTFYQGMPQINVDRLAALGPKDLSSISWADFLPAAVRDREEMWSELLEILGTLENPYLTSLCDAFASDGGFKEVFINVPAAKGIHHVYLGGLLEHTLSVARLVDGLAGLYPLNRDILLMGAFLHDVGKVRELTYRAGFDYTDEGRLLGHIVLGVEMLRERAAQVSGFPRALLVHLEHLILSHHGENEWGSPKKPKTLEAFALHALDNLDAKITGARQWMEKEDGVEGDWTAYWRILGRPLYRPPLSGPDFGETGAGETMESIEAEFLREERERGVQEPEVRDGPPSKRQRDLGF